MLQVKLEAKSGSKLSGSAMLMEVEGGVKVTLSVEGVTPPGDRGAHVHEKGDCSSGDGMSTGGHFNPDAKPHGPQVGPHHGGDMPSLSADANGNAQTSFTLDEVTVAAGPKSVVGKGLIVHKDPDDYATQPTGNSGARIACGVIKRDPTPGN